MDNLRRAAKHSDMGSCFGAPLRSLGNLPHSWDEGQLSFRTHAPPHSSRGRARLLTFWILTALFGQPGCTKDQGEREERPPVDPAGAAVVAYDGPDRLLNWTFEPVLDLGTANGVGPTAFFRVSTESVGTDSTQNIYVLDAGRHVVSVFDNLGGHLHSYGRKGGGPGEFGFPAYLSVDSRGNTAVYDYDKRALVLFARDGSYEELFPLPIPMDGRIVSMENGDVAAAVAEPIAGGDSVNVRLLLLGSDTTEVANVKRLNAFEQQRFACPMPALPSLFLPRIIWDGNGDRIASSDDFSYSVRVRGPSRQSAVWKRDLPSIAGTLELAAWDVADGDSLRVFGCAVGPEEAAEKLGYGDTAPTIKDITVTPSGGAWILRRTAVPGEQRIDVWDQSGRYLGTLPTGSPFPALFRGSDEIVTVEPDEFDVPHVVVYKISKVAR